MACRPLWPEQQVRMHVPGTAHTLGQTTLHGSVILYGVPEVLLAVARESLVLLREGQSAGGTVECAVDRVRADGIAPTPADATSERGHGPPSRLFEQQFELEEGVIPVVLIVVAAPHT